MCESFIHLPPKACYIPPDGIGRGEGMSFINKPKRRSGIRLVSCRSSIALNADNYMKASIRSLANTTVDHIKHYAEVQRWNGSSWVSYSLFCSSYTNSREFIGNDNVFLLSGYFYRLRSVHIIEKGTGRDTEMLFSSYIWVQ